MMYLFDPVQFPEFGALYYQGDGFSYRYQSSKKLFMSTIYIPLGPNCESEQGFDNFLEHIKSQKFTKTRVDLPVVYEPRRREAIISKMSTAGFKKSDYIFQDDETLLVIASDLNLSGEKMKRVRYGLNRADVFIKNSLTDQEIDDIYKIYLISVERIGVDPKDKSVFKKLAENCLVSLAYDKESKKLEGYLLCYFVKSDLSDIVGKSEGTSLLAMFTGLTDKGRDYKLGHAIHYELFREAFEKYGVDLIDFHGASRKKGRSYIEFKQVFGDRFMALPGSFTRRRFF